MSSADVTKREKVAHGGLPFFICTGEILFCSEIFLKLGGGTAFGIGQVADDLAMLQQGDAGGDVDSMLQVMAGDDDGSASLTGIVGDEVLQHQLTGGVEEVEGLVEDDRLGLAE